MTGEQFVSAHEQRRRVAVAAERDIERLKRALERYCAAHPLRPRTPVGRYLTAIGVRADIRPGAGLEFAHGDPVDVADAMAHTPVPAMLNQYWD